MRQIHPPPASALLLFVRLQDRLAGIAAMDLPPDLKNRMDAVLQDAKAVHLALTRGPITQVDRSTFDALLALAGPEIAPELLRQLSEDLADVATGLSASLQSVDWEAMRAQTHVLVALAGSVGARSLQEAASRLNIMAHEEARAATVHGAEVLAGLVVLRRFIDDERATHTTKP